MKTNFKSSAADDVKDSALLQAYLDGRATLAREILNKMYKKCSYKQLGKFVINEFRKAIGKERIHFHRTLKLLNEDIKKWMSEKGEKKEVSRC